MRRNVDPRDNRKHKTAVSFAETRAEGQYLSDSGWQQIFTALSEAPEAHLINEVSARQYLEEMIREWRCFRPEQLTTTNRACMEILQALRTLRNQREASEAGALLLNHSEFTKSLQTIETHVLRFDSKAEGLHSSRNYQRSMFFDLLTIWEAAGGMARRSTANDGATPSGPCVRFLVVSGRVLGFPITPHQAARLIRQRAGMLKTLTGSRSLADAYELIRRG